jgi:hypothetical protein
MKRLLATLILTGLAGCAANHDVALRDATSSRQYLYQSPTDGNATITVERAYGLSGGGCSSAILVDNQVAGQVEIGERAVFHVPSGNHDIALEQRGTCSGAKANVQAAINPGDNVVFELDADGTSMMPGKS